MQPTKQQILRLYKHLIRYSNQIQLTDRLYFVERIRREFKRDITDKVEIEFNYKRGGSLLKNGRVI